MTKFDEGKQKRWRREQDRRGRETFDLTGISFDPLGLLKMLYGHEPSKITKSEVVEGLVRCYLKGNFPGNYHKITPEAQKTSVDSFLETRPEFRCYFQGRQLRTKGQICDALRLAFEDMPEERLIELYRSEILPKLLPQKGSYQQGGE